MSAAQDESKGSEAQDEKEAGVVFTGPYGGDEGDVLLIHPGRGQGQVGAVEYKVVDGVVEIWHIDAHERRKGIASALMDELRRRYPGYDFDPLNLSDEGMAFWQAYWMERER